MSSPAVHLESLNNSQRKAAGYGETVPDAPLRAGPLLVIAGAGTGKTNTLAFDQAGRAALSDHVRTSGKATFRIGATPLFPVGMHIFGWQGATGANTKPPTLHTLTVTQLP